MFRPTLLSEAEATNAVRVSGRTLVVHVQPEWAAPGEKRLGYATQVRVVECVRELHWRIDVAAKSESTATETITRVLALDFVAPVDVHADILGTYSVPQVTNRSYTLIVELVEGTSGQILTRANLTNVFYDPALNRSVQCPPQVRNWLLRPPGI